MDIEAKQLLKENLELAKDNNVMLKKIVRAQKLAHVYRMVYWGIIIFTTAGVSYFIQPYLSSMLNIYTGGVSGIENITDITKNLGNSKQQMQDLFNSLNK